MRFVIDDKTVLSQEPTGPVAPYIERFATSLRQQGYGDYSVHRHVLLAASFSVWLTARRVALRGITSDHFMPYLEHRAHQLRPRCGDSAALTHLIEFLRCLEIVPAEEVPVRKLTSAESFAQEYEHHLRKARGLAEATIGNYVPFIQRFLEDRFGHGVVTLSRLHASDIVRFVQRQAVQLHPKRAKLLTTALRSFLQYVRYRGESQLDLAAAVPIVANWSMSSIPRAIPTHLVQELLASIDRNTAMGRRDYAILLLLARLGLRSGEVASLDLDDIDWNRAQLTICGKTGRRSKLPLSAEVGEAISAYLRYGRSQSTSRRVFLRAKAPIIGFQGASGIGSIVRHRLQRAGINAPTYGAHQFRHGLATELLHRGASLSEIGDVLGHHNPQTTMIYTKVDLDALRHLALPWPGGVR